MIAATSREPAGRPRVVAAALLLIAVAVAVATVSARGAEPPSAPSPEVALGRALRFLAAEVPRWRVENGCYSCHNNGDAARALYEARRRGAGVDVGVPLATLDATLADTTAWLVAPGTWDRDGGDGPARDAVLARVQFTAALAAARAAGATADRTALDAAARRLAADQQADGSWPVAGDPGAVGSPAGYGRPLATLAARDALRAIDPARHAAAIARADRWLAARPTASVMDASIALLAEVGDPARHQSARERLRQGQSDDGGWGPYVDAPPEPFDTALALLALAKRPAPDADTTARIRRGRAFLAASQQADGGWPATTRPAGADSYAERVSTAGWAALALMATRGRSGPDPKTSR